MLQKKHASHTIDYGKMLSHGAKEQSKPICPYCPCKLIRPSEKNDPEKRLSLKEHVYEIARTRNYSEAIISSLLTFITELIILPIEFHTKFTEFIFKYRKSTKMAHLSEQSLNLADAIAKKEYGSTYSEMKAERAKTIVLLKEERAQLKEERVKTIILLYTKFQMPIDEIAKDLGFDVNVVRDVLKKQKLIKK